VVEFIRQESPPHPIAIEHEGETWELMPASPRIVTADTRGFKEMPNDKKLAREGRRVIEPGYENEISSTKRAIAKQKDAELEESVVATINRAMP